MSFEDKLRSELLFKNIQIKEFAGMINIPYSTHLSYLDGSNRLPKVEILNRMAKVLGVSIEYLIDCDCDELSCEGSLYKEFQTLPINVQKCLLYLIREMK